MDAASYTADERLRDGEAIRIRAIRPDDKGRLVETFERLTERTVYFRFMEPKPHLTDADLRHLTEVDYRNHVALAAVMPDEDDGHERIVGVGRYYAAEAPEGVRTAEVAFTVDDAFQGRGICTHLLHHLGRIAHADGIERLEAFVHPDNRPMLDVFEHGGYPMRERADSDLVHVVMELNDPGAA